MQHINLLRHVPPDLRRDVKSFSFSRWGGVSARPFDELNVGCGAGDRKENVRTNLGLIRKFSGLEKIISVHQVHGSKILHAAGGHFSPAEEPGSEPEADGIISQAPNTGLMIRHADCQAVVMFDPVQKVAANIHCGWRGSIEGILSKGVRELSNIYGSRPRDIWAGISPSLGPCCGEFRDWKAMLPEWIHLFQVRPGHFDFWAISKMQLTSAGIPEKQIYCAGICTACNRDYFSYRREGLTGRMGTVIALSD